MAAWIRTISSGANFAGNQSRHNNSSSSSSSKGFISAVQDCTRLSCLLPPVSSPYNGIPDPTLQFLHQILQTTDSNVVDVKFTVMASTNGLLLLFPATTTASRCPPLALYLCNPATKEAHEIPDSRRWFWKDSVGLAFDPCTSPHHYTLVRPVVTYLPGGRGVEHKFEVFFSQRADQEWVMSSQKVVLPLPTERRCEKAVFARGVLYWHCTDFLLWFDCNKDTAGHVELPLKPGGDGPGLREIGVKDGSVVTWTRVSEGAVEVFELTDGNARWEKRHCLGLDENRVAVLTVRMRDEERKRKWKRKRSIGSSGSDGGSAQVQDDQEPLWKKLMMQPLPFEGGNKVYVRVKLSPPWMKRPNYYLKMEKLLSIDLSTGEVAQESDQDKLLIGYDNFVFGYSCNLAPLPNL